MAPYVIRGRERPVLRGEVSAGEDVRGGEGGAVLDAMEEEDPIRRGYEEDASAGTGGCDGFVAFVRF